MRVSPENGKNALEKKVDPDFDIGDTIGDAIFKKLPNILLPYRIKTNQTLHPD
jgi:hypothetical protein